MSSPTDTPLVGDLESRIRALEARFDLAPAFVRGYLLTKPHIREVVEAAGSESDLFARLGPLYEMYVRFALSTTKRGQQFVALISAGEILNADVLRCDRDQLGTFDLIACNDVIEHVQDARELVRRVARLLDPEGIAYFEIPNRDAITFVARDGHFQKFVLTLLRRPMAARYFEESLGRSYDEMGELYDEATYRAWFAEANLAVLDVPQLHAPGEVH